ncbi:MAG TPA: NAD-dependent epimerase/dehydratase family protein [Pirellulales bacterium]|jgi:dTDP-glucose 4,6-dehydratase
MITGKKVLITGGAGFIATHMAERLAERNEVTLFDIDLNGSITYSPLNKDSRVRKVQGDVRNLEAVQEEVSRCQILLHYASILGVRKVIDNARDTIDTVLFGTRNVLEAARHNPKIERIVNISTSEVYGNVMDAREGNNCLVSTANDARVCYASSKLAAEHIVWAYHRDFKLPTVIVRPFNIFGPMRKTDNAVGRFCVRAIANKDVTLIGDGSQLRSWCYIDDFCDAMSSCIETEKAIGEDFNFGNPVTAVTIYDLADRTIRLAKSSSKITTTAHTFSDIGVRAPSSVKARDLLGYVPKFNLDAGLLPTIEWYRQNLNDFRDWL